MIKANPPRFAQWIIGLFAQNDQTASIIHNFEEEYFEILQEKGSISADAWYWSQVIKSIPNLIRFSLFWGVMMLRNYFKTAVRSIIKQKDYSIINIGGLAVGLASAMMILFWVQNELSYDDFHADNEDIYRIRISRTVEGNTFEESDTPYLIAKEIKDKIPAVQYSSTYLHLPKFVVKNENKKFYEEGIRAGGADFFLIFSFDFIEGDNLNALAAPGSVVITESIAEKYFGNTPPTGEVIQINGIPFKITGIIRDVPELSHLQFDFMIDSYFIENNYKEMLSWNNFSSRNYLKLRKGSDSRIVGNEINNVLVKNYNPEDISRFRAKFIIQPLGEIYLTDSVKKYLYIFSLLAFLILFIASMNYINLSTAISLKRLKEIGIRKVIGSNRMQLVNQFFMETVVITLLAAVFAIIIDILLLPLFGQLIGKPILIDFFDYKFILTFISVIIITSILAGSYPALYISSYQSMKVLKAGYYSGKWSDGFRRILVVSQYTISIGLIISTIIVSDQVGYLINKDLGFDKDGTIYIPLAGNIKDKYELLENELTQNPKIAGVAYSSYLPTARGRSRAGIEWPGKDPAQRVMAETPEIGYTFFELLGLEIIEGRNFSKEFITDTDQAFIINEEMAKQLNKTSPIGEEISFTGHKGKVIGVVKNANFLPLQYNIEPQVFSLLTNMRKTIRGVVLIKLNKISGAEIEQSISFVEDVWNKFNPDEPFEYNFWNVSLEEQYTSEQTISSLFNYFSMLSIIISCLGLYGLAAFTVTRSTKAIGIRKVLGASASKITIGLSKEFINTIIIANIIAWPIAYYFMIKWLNDFAYKISINLWSFLSAGALALIIALATISFHVLKAVKINPVESLRSE